MRYLVLLFCAVFVISFAGCKNNISHPESPVTSRPGTSIGATNVMGTDSKKNDDTTIDGIEIKDDYSRDILKYNNMSVNYKYLVFGNNAKDEETIPSYEIKSYNSDYNVSLYYKTFIRRIIETDYIDIYIDLNSESLRTASDSFGAENWVSFINTFIKYKDVMESMYGKYTAMPNMKTNKINLIFTTFDNDITGYFDYVDLKEDKEYKLHISRSFIDNNNTDKLERLENEFFYLLQHLQNASVAVVATEQAGNGLENKGRERTERWIDNVLSESTLYVVRGDSFNLSKLNNYNNTSFNQNVREGKYFPTWDHLDRASSATGAIFSYWLYKHFDTNVFRDIAMMPETLNRNNISLADFVNVLKKKDKKLSSWDTIYGHWLKASIVNASSGYNGYKNVNNSGFKIEIPYLTTETSIDLKMGGALYLFDNTTIIDSNSNLKIIKYKEPKPVTLVYNPSTNPSSSYNIKLKHITGSLSKSQYLSYENSNSDEDDEKYDWGNSVVFYHSYR